MQYKKPTNVLSEHDLQELDKELRTYEVERYNRVFKCKTKTIDTKAWMISKGAVTKAGAIVIHNYKRAEYSGSGKVIEPSDCDPILYETLTHEYEQWLTWRARKEYGTKRDLERLQVEANKLCTT